MLGLLRITVLIVGVLCASACSAAPKTMKLSDPNSPLSLKRVIALPDARGRIDHLAIDPAHRRLYVAEYGNGSVDEIDLASGRVTGRISGLHQPQGVAYAPASGEIVVACGDGSVRFYRSGDRHETARLALGDDADNVRIDPRNGHVIVGYGAGGLATIDPATHKVIARLALPGHPESFRLAGARVFVNVPDRGDIVVGDIDQGRIVSTWRTGAYRLNFPMAITPSGSWLAIGYRLPAALAVIDSASGNALSTQQLCGDADDLFVAGKRILAVCGAGHVDLRSADPGKTEAIRVMTAPGARTGLFVPQTNTLFVAIPARGKPAAIWELAVAPNP